jgi:hypothetical protein
MKAVRTWTDGTAGPAILGVEEAAVPAPAESMSDSSEMTSSFRTTLKNQYHASLAMLGQAVERCPDDLWTDPSYPNAFWHVAYHGLFFAHLYLHENVEAFRPWEKHRAEYQFMGTMPMPPHRSPNIGEPYTRAEVLEYLRLCEAFVNEAVDRMDLRALDCGFPWYKVSKQEHQLVNIRHIQHHAAQLMDRLRTKVGVGVEWAAGGSRP